ncbi:MAG: hypothetical protein ACI8RE_001919, partial [Ilumatobacter sp.]
DTRKRFVGLFGEPVEDRCHIFEGFCFKETSEQHVALFPQCELFVEVTVAHVWQKATGFEVDERGGDEQEAGCHIEIENLDPVQFAYKGIDDC